MNQEQLDIINAMIRENPRMRFGSLADLLIKHQEFKDFKRDDLLIELARKAFNLRMI